ncbi:Putative F-box protein At1g67623 [Linum grandiflorum]
MEVLSHVASNSIADLLNFKKTCKLVSESASERHVLQNAAVLDKYFFHGRFGLDDKNNFSNFMARCMDSDNNEALFCRGIEDYFRGDGGTLKLRVAAEKGMKVARYAYGMFTLLAEEDPATVEQGFRFLRGLRKAKDLVECRETVKYVVRRNMWVDDVYRNHRLFRGSGRSIYGGRCGCNREGRSLASFSKNSDFEWLEIEEQVRDLVDSGLCDSCFWKFEACVLLKGCTGSLKN